MTEPQKPKIFQGYTLGKKLVTRGPLVVVEAEPEAPGPSAIVKFLNWALIEDGDELAREAQSAARFIMDDFPDLLEFWPLEQAGIQKNWFYMIELRRDSLPLREALELHGPIEAAECVRRMAALADTLIALHARGLIAGFMHPENVLVDHNGMFRLGDFLTSAFEYYHARSRNRYIPLVGCLAPELLRGEETDPRSDVFGLAAIMYRAVTGRNPFPDKEDRSPQWDVRGVPVDCGLFGAGCTPHFSQTLRWALTPDPDRRPPHVERFMEDVLAALHEPAQPAAPPPIIVTEEAPSKPATKPRQKIKPAPAPAPKEPPKPGPEFKPAPERSRKSAPSADKKGPDWVPPELADAIPRRSGSSVALIVIIVITLGAAAGYAAFKYLPFFAKKPPAPAPVQHKAVSQCPPDMAFIPTGKYTLGDDTSRDSGVAPRHKAPVHGFCVDLYEYPNKNNVKPRAGVSWDQASAACGKQGKRLCEENEWEAACAGPDGNVYPYGSTYSPNICNTFSSGLAPAGLYQGCAAKGKTADMSGNLMEWTADWYARDKSRTLRGGAWKTRSAAKCSARFDPEKTDPKNIGFRCCLGVK